MTRQVLEFKRTISNPDTKKHYHALSHRAKAALLDHFYGLEDEDDYDDYWCDVSSRGSENSGYRNNNVALLW